MKLPSTPTARVPVSDDASKVPSPDNRRRVLFLCALLAVVIAGVFWPIHRHEFIKFDDGDYISNNPHVLSGLSWRNLGWSFQAGYAANWHPLTWLSHMLDVQLFGPEPEWHHLVSLGWHIANSLLLFLLLLRLTGAKWRSAMVAALFALHPLHVESVAWAAERKDVLCAFFLFGTLLAYTSYVRKLAAQPADRNVGDTADKNVCGTPDAPRSHAPTLSRSYALTLLLFALALMSKPMAVTGPFILLLLDFWPLRRFEAANQQSRRALRLLIEKLPFIALTIVACILTIIAQSRGHAVKEWIPLSSRIVNALISYLKYLGKTFWPTDLAIFYPLHNLQTGGAGQSAATASWHLLWTSLTALVVLGLVTCLTVWQRKSRPWLFTGWFWFLGTLVPVIGLVQVGGQAMADRYTYVPLVGVFIVVVWTAGELATRLRQGPVLAAVLGLCTLTACAVLTRVQLATWQNAFTVFTHDLKIAGPNATALNCVGLEYATQGKFDLALTNLYGAIEEAPLYAEAHANVAFVLGRQGRLNEAIPAFQTALKIQPWNDGTRANFASTLQAAGRRQEALAEAAEVLRWNPQNALAHYVAGLALQENGELSRAEAQFTEAYRLNPTNPDPLNRLAELQLKQGRMGEAEASFREAARLAPHDAQARVNLGGLLWRLGRADEASIQFADAVRADPTHPGAHYNLGFALSARGQLPKATEEFREAVRLSPNYLEAWTALGRALAAQGQFAEAVSPFREAARIAPTNSNCQLNFANALWLTGQSNEAAVAFANVNRLDPGLAGQLVEAGKKLLGQSQANTAVARFRVALQLQPDNAEALQELAWVLATSPDASLRNGTEAVQMAERACTLTNAEGCRVRGILDAAYAEAGRFTDAVQAAEQAKNIAVSAGDQARAKAAESRLELYHQQRPFRQGGAAEIK